MQRIYFQVKGNLCQSKGNELMLSEGLKNIDSTSVIIGIAEGEEPESLNVLLRVSKEGFSDSARAFLFEYCKVKIGFAEVDEYLEKHAEDPRLAWAVQQFHMKNKWSFEPDDAARRLVAAICDGSEADVIEAVDAGGCIMTSDMLFYTIPLSDLSDETLRYLFVHAMSLPVRCLAVLSIVEQIPEHRDTRLYDVFCNMVTILIDILIKNEGI